MSLLLAAALLVGQTTPTPKLPPANPIPLADADTSAVMAPINAFLAGVAARDPQAILAVVRPDGGATYATEAADGGRSITRRTWAEVAARFAPGADRWDERISDPAIESDGDIAMVWAPYTFRVNGKVHHCGTDHFDLIREGGVWKIANASWSSRTTGCDAQ
ncbi:nuclear transport factor 2 family protein [Sphingomonas sp. H39-1-10]|uniref:nuclear transport factor 2 family protein n=1 Tax=Sphingomonas pollutisoli TaxID=3030829 RepID=UPI0023B99C2C|nr:nuclear transport factor 2 family protein [Sphingomonas pollutisoli]MDF0488946.1 nuclear transport factor 2 family protein [Sphingomonas pollutisoli]